MLSILPMIEDASPPVVWTMVFMLWYVFINPEDFSGAPYSSTRMNATFLSWFLNMVTRNFRMSRGGRLLLDVNQKWYEVTEHIAEKLEVNPRMLSTLKNAKSIWIMNPGAILETSVVVPLGILVALINRQIGKDYSKSGIFSGRPSMCTFITINFSLVIETWPKRWWISWDFVLFWKCTYSWDKNITVFVRVDFDNFDLNIVNIVLSLVGWSPRRTLRVKKVKVTMLKRFRRNLLRANIKFEGTLLYGIGRVTRKIINCSHWIYDGTFRKET